MSPFWLLRKENEMINKEKRPRDRWLQDKDFLSKLFHLTFPIALQSLMLAVVAAADALMLGIMEQNSMSAVSLATQIQFVQNMALGAAVSALTILGAQYWGKKEIHTLKRLFSLSLTFCGVVSVLFFIGCVFFPRYLMLLFTNEEVLISIGIDYLKIAGWSYLMTGVSQNYLALLKVSDKPNHAAWISSTTVVLNIILNAVFIFGLLGAPAMGVRGAALATLISRTVELVWSMILSYCKGFITPSFKAFFRHTPALNKSFAKCMLPILGACLLWGVGFTSYTSFMGHLGTDAAAGNSVASVVRDLICCLCNGIAAGGGIIVGNELGAGNLEKGKLYGDRVCKIGFLCGFASTLIMLALTPVVLAFVKLTEGAQELLLGMMVIMSFYMIGRAVNTVIINGIFSAGGDTLFDMYSLAVTMWGLAVPLAILGTFVLNWPVLVVYACTCLDEVGKIPWVMLHYKKYKWVRDLTVKETEA